MKISQQILNKLIHKTKSWKTNNIIQFEAFRDALKYWKDLEIDELSFQLLPTL